MSDTEHFLKYIKIKDFKCFVDFKAEGFKRVNLIGGKNNVGKTAFMEACYVNIYSENITFLMTALADIKRRRENLNIPFLFDLEEDNNNKNHLEQSKNIYTSTNINTSSF